MKPCPFCGEEISATATKCIYCGSELTEKTEEKEVIYLGYERDIIVQIILCFVTCGIYTLLLLYLVGRDIKWHYPKAKISPGTNVLIILIGIIAIAILIVGTGMIAYVSNVNVGGIQLKLHKYADMIREESQLTVYAILAAIMVAIVTLYYIYVIYKYAHTAYIMAVEENIPATDQTFICIIAAILCPLFAPIGIQYELDKHWQFHRELRYRKNL